MPVQKNISLKPYNTFGIEVEAEYFAHITTVEELEEILKNLDFKDIPKHILGGGSNILAGPKSYFLPTSQEIAASTFFSKEFFGLLLCRYNMSVEQWFNKRTTLIYHLYG